MLLLYGAREKQFQIIVKGSMQQRSLLRPYEQFAFIRVSFLFKSSSTALRPSEKHYDIANKRSPFLEPFQQLSVLRAGFKFQ